MSRYPAFRWTRYRYAAGGYFYACMAELRRSGGQVHRDENGWYYTAKGLPRVYEKEVGRRRCSECGTVHPGTFVGFTTAKEAKRALEAYLNEKSGY